MNALLVVSGLLCMKNLALREYPSITFPTITVTAQYPNASAELVETAVTNPLEDNLAGIEGLEDITSQSENGSSQITLTFKVGTPMDRAVSATQDAVGLAKPLLPAEVKAPQVERQRENTELPFLAIALESDNMEFGELTHFANLRLKNEFRSVTGVSSVKVWGQPYTYEINLDPEKLYAFGVNVDEVLDALTKSRVSLPAGNFRNKIPSTLNSELTTINDYEQLLVKTNRNTPILLKSVADIKLTTDNSTMRVRVNGHPGLIVSVDRTADSNPLIVAKLVREHLNAIKKTLPPGLKSHVILDQSEFINKSLQNIRSAIFEAIFLVLIIVFVFLRNIKATLIPLVTIPISLLGSLIFLKIFGFSLNLMTLLAMVLAIGLVVDDAIIVLENIWRHLESGKSSFEAALAGAKEIGFAIIAMTFTLVSVYIPIAFIDGILGQLFIEFAVALAGSVFISGIVALSLTPLMCAKLLNKSTQPHFPQVDVFIAYLTKKYSQGLQWVGRRSYFTLIISSVTIIASVLLYTHIPSETAPKEDRGLVGVFTPILSSESIADADKKVQQLEKKTNSLAEAEQHLTFIGSWGSSIVLPLIPHTERRRNAEEIVEQLKPEFAHFPSVDPMVWSWDNGLPGVDNAGRGTELSLVISTPDSFRDLYNQAEQIRKKVDDSHQFSESYYDLKLDTLGYAVELDNNNLAKLGLSPSQVAKTIAVFFSGDRSINFQKDSISYNLTVQGKHSPWTLNELYLTTPSGSRVSLGALTEMKEKSQPATLEHFRQMRSTTLHVQFPASVPFDQAMNKLEQLAKENLPAQYKLSWTGAAKAYTESSHTMLYLLLLAIVFIYAILSIQFENFIDPFIILFTVPLACSGALLITYLTGQSLNVYSQVGLITLIGLISKHGILIVEFANQLKAEGLSAKDAIGKACQLRLRPILMTTGAMIFGAIPLILSRDAGYESRHAIGTVLIGGLTIGTFFTLFILPGVYSLIKERKIRQA